MRRYALALGLVLTLGQSPSTPPALPAEVSAWVSLVEAGGVLACLVLFGWLLITDRLLTRSQAAKLLDAKDTEIARLVTLIDKLRADQDAELAQVRASRDRREASLIADRDYWRDTVRTVLSMGETLARRRT